MPKAKAARDTFLLTVGEDGFVLLDAINQVASEKLRELEKVKTLNAVWDRHYERKEERVRWRDKTELTPSSLRTRVTL